MNYLYKLIALSTVFFLFAAAAMASDEWTVATGVMEATFSEPKKV